MPRTNHVTNRFLSLLALLGCACFISLSSATVYADGCDAVNFKGVRDIALGQSLEAVVAGDFNNDGKADVAGVDFLGDNVRVGFGDGAGGITSVSSFAIGTDPKFIAAGDLNNDGKLDLVASNSQSHDVSVLLNNGSGGFTVTSYGAGVSPGAIALADFNSDSKLDVAVTNQAGSAIVLLFNNGSGGLLPLTFVSLPGRGPRDIVAADFNNDGKVDLATANNPGGPMTTGDVAVLLGTGTGTFGAPSYFFNINAPFGDPTTITAGDFTGDGKVDLLVGSYSSHNIRIMPGNGAGAFTINLTAIQTGNAYQIELSDINFDSKLDIVLLNYDATVRVYYGDGLGGVSQTQDVLVGVVTRGVAIKDFNNDGKLDIAATYASLFDSGVSMSLNDGTGQLETVTMAVPGTPGTPTLYDLNLDSILDLITGSTVRLGLADGTFGSPTTYPGAGGGHITIADFNGDNRPDIAGTGGSSVSVLLNNGNGTFGTATNYNVGSTSFAIVHGDFNSDGKLDLAVAANSSRSVRVFTGNGLGGFLLTGSFSVNANPNAIVAGDFNNDGKLDVVTANECDQQTQTCTAKMITLFPGNGAGGFGAAVDLYNVNPPDYFTEGRIQPQFLAVADFNADAKPDLTFGRALNNVFAPLVVAINGGGGNFMPLTTLPSGVDVRVLTVGDINGDGKPDIVAGRGGYSRDIQIFLNNGAGSFDPAVNYAGVYRPGGIAIGDINRDGKRDILFSDSVGQVWKLLNKCALRRGNQTTDFDGDGITDLSVFRPSNGYWYIIYSSDNTFHPIPFGTNGDIPVAADFDGDSRTDVAVWRPSNGTWYYLRSSDGAFAYQQFGANGDIPLPGDYNGDGSADFVVWRQSTGIWYTSLDPASNYGAVPWGFSTDIPAPADYDGDGRIDIAVFRPSNATWYLQQTTQGYKDQQFGISTDRPVPADYDGDGRADFAVFRESTGVWYTSLNPVINYGAIQLGQSGDVTVPGFYDGDGRADAAVFRNGDWYIRQSFNGAVTTTHFGASGDLPAPVAP
jgi:hypothetical protein